MAAPAARRPPGGTDERCWAREWPARCGERFPKARRFEGRPFTLGDLARWAEEFEVLGEAAIIDGRRQIIRSFDVPRHGCIGLRCDGLGIAALDDLLEFAGDRQIPETTRRQRQPTVYSLPQSSRLSEITRGSQGRP